MYERLIWFLSIVYTSSFTIFSSNFSPLYVYIYFYLFVALCKIVQMYYYYYLSLFFHLDGIFAGTFKTSAEQSANTYFFSKSCCVLHYYMWGNEPRAIRLLYKKDKNKSFPGFCCNSFSRYVLIIRQSSSLVLNQV